MRCVKIIQIPPGKTPEWVRRELIGITVPLSQSGGSHTVSTEQVIRALRNSSPGAAQWLERNLHPRKHPTFPIPKDCVK